MTESGFTPMPVPVGVGTLKFVTIPVGKEGSAEFSPADARATWDDELGYYGDDELGEMMELRAAAVLAGDMEKARGIERQMSELELLTEAHAAAVLAGDRERAQDIERQMEELLASHGDARVVPRRTTPGSSAPSSGSPPG
jgi:hypothetical protein